MKKIIISLAVLLSLSSCGITSIKSDMEMLQKKYPTVYRIDQLEYICIDSTNVYHVSVNLKGSITSTIKIK